MANLEKLNKELEQIESKISSLISRKKEIEGKIKSAQDAEIREVVESTNIPISRFLSLSKLSKDELEKVLNYADSFSNTNISEKESLNEQN